MRTPSPPDGAFPLSVAGELPGHAGPGPTGIYRIVLVFRLRAACSEGGQVPARARTFDPRTLSSAGAVMDGVDQVHRRPAVGCPFINAEACRLRGSPRSAATRDRGVAGGVEEGGRVDRSMRTHQASRRQACGGSPVVRRGGVSGDRLPGTEWVGKVNDDSTDPRSGPAELREPVNGLDPEGVLWIRNLMKQLAA